MTDTQNSWILTRQLLRQALDNQIRLFLDNLSKATTDQHEQIVKEINMMLRIYPPVDGPFDVNYKINQSRVTEL